MSDFHAGRQIDKILAEKGMMQKELSEKTGFSQQSIYQMKKSKRLQYNTIARLSRALEVPSTFFLHTT